MIPSQFFVPTGAVNGSADFRNLAGDLPLRRTRSCSGNESNLSQCPKSMSSADEGRTCGRSDNAYIVCQGMLLLSFRVGVLRSLFQIRAHWCEVIRASDQP